MTLYNKNNYEIFAIDYLDGTMSKTDTQAFEKFLELNPEIKDEVDALKDNAFAIDLDESETDFSFLKKELNEQEPNANNLEELCIACHEGDLNQEATTRLKQFIEGKQERMLTFELYKKLRVTADSNIRFLGKRSIKRLNIKKLRRNITIGISSVAAALALMFYIHTSNNNPLESEYFVHTTPETQRPLTEVPDTVKEVNKGSNTPDATPAIEKPVDEQVMEATPPPHKTSIIETNLIAAVADTSTNENDELIRIAAIKPKKMPLVNALSEEDLLAEILGVPNKSTVKTNESSNLQRLIGAGNSVYSKASKLTVDKAVRYSINGINHIAETELEYQSKTNDQGKITDIELKSDRLNLAFQPAKIIKFFSL